MATYLPGVTDYIPQIQPWEPDYNFYQDTLERKQQSYDRGWEQTNSIYNSILNAPMMRGQNVERRDNFFKEIEGQIQQMSGVDLSLQQNVDAASQVFKPFYENEDIIHDISYTKKYSDQMQHADYLKNCTDEKECGGKYWPEGQRLLGYKAQEFVNATDEDALRMQAPSYVNNVNFMDKATKAIDEVGKGKWEMVTTSFDGGYKIVTKNGQQQIGTLQNFMMARFGDDPEVSAYYGAKAEIMGYENPEELINQYELAGLRSEASSQEELDSLVKERAEKKRFDAAVGTIEQNAKTEKSELEDMTNRRDILDGLIRSNGVLPNSKEANDYRDIITELPTKKEAVRKSEQASAYLQNMQYTDKDGNKISNNVITNVVANALLMNEIRSTANTLAYRDYSVTYDEDAFAVASYKNQLDMARDDRSAQRTNAESTIKYIRDRGAAEGANPLEISRRDVIDRLTIGEGMMYKGKDHKGLSNADALVIYRELFAGKNNTGHPAYDGKPDSRSGTKTVDDKDIKADTKLTTALEKADSDDEKDGDNLATTIDDLNNIMYADANLNQITYLNNEAEMVNGHVKELIQTAIDPGAPNKSISNQGLWLIGDMVSEAPEKNPALYNELVKNGMWDKYFKNFPNSENKGMTGTNTLANINSAGLSHYVGALAGNDRIVKLMSNKDVKITVRDKKDPTLIDTKALGIMSHEERKNIEKMRIEAAADGGTFSMSDELNTAISMYDNKTDSVRGINANNYLHTLFTDEQQQAITTNAWQKKNAKDMTNSVNLTIDAVAKIYGEERSLEKEGIMSAFMRKNVVQKPSKHERVTSSRLDMYNAAAAEGVSLLKDYEKENFTWGIQPSIAQLEGDTDYSVDGEGLFLEGDALQGVLATSDMPVDIEDIDFNQLYQDNNIPVMIPRKVQDQGKTGWSTAGTETFNYEPMWSTLIDDPKTKITRQNKDIIIQSPYLKVGGGNLVLKTSDIEVSEGLQDMFNEINQDYTGVIKGYGKRIQNTPNKPKYKPYGTANSLGGLNSNYNVTSPGLEGIQLVPDDKIPLYDDYVDLFKEAQTELGKVNLSQYGIDDPHGDPAFLNNVILALEDTYDKGKNMPIFDISYLPVAGSAELTKVTIELNDYKSQDWIKSMGQEITGVKMPAQEEGDSNYRGIEGIKNEQYIDLPGGTGKGARGATSGTYYIKNSESPIILNSKPNEYQNVIANIPIDSSWTDDSQYAKYGGKFRYNRVSADKAQVYMIFDEKNWDTGVTTPKVEKMGGLRLIRGFEWEQNIKIWNDALKIRSQQQDEDLENSGALVHNPEDL